MTITSSYQQRYSLTNNCLVAHYLMHSYLYYELDESIITDGEYDGICKRLLYVYDELKHMHLHLVTKDLLECGSGFNIEYTNLIKDAAILWRDNNITCTTSYDV